MTGYKHGNAVPSKRSGTYRSWESAKARCRNPANPDFHNYGARGINFSPDWDRFEDFLFDMGHRPDGTSLDRIDSNGNYEKSNCRWATVSQQGRNKSSNRLVPWMGANIPMVELSEKTGVPYQLLYDRIVRGGWNVEKAVSKKKRVWPSQTEAA